MGNQLIEFIDTLDQSLKKINAEVKDNSGFSKLTIHQLQYIGAIDKLRKPTITEIAEELKITKSSVTDSINKLEKMGFVIKIQSLEDRRVFHVILTETGEQLKIIKQKALEEYEALINAALSADEINKFNELLSKLIQHFNISNL